MEWMSFFIDSLGMLANFGELLAQSSGSVIDMEFMNKIKKLWCDLMSKSGPVVPIVSGAAVAIFAVLFAMDEGKNYISTALRIALGIAILVFVPSLLKNWLGIDLGCGTT
ncbi:MAG: hypothetical protein N2690_00170 [Rhodocyclaceae bacterium]|nr:hypothetical protein [Rhodocyclaceae bacterium]